MSRGLVWFRNDLRLHDNEAVSKAIAENDHVLFLYNECQQYTPPQVADIPINKDLKSRFRLQCVNDLHIQLQQRGAALHYIADNTLQTIASLCSRHQITTVYITAEYAQYEIHQETELSKFVQIKKFHTSTLLHPELLTFSVSQLPDVFTSFRKKVESLLGEIVLQRAPQTINAITDDQYLKIPDAKHATHQLNNRGWNEFTGGRAAAIKRLKNYFFESKLVSVYKETRNGLLGMDYSTKFSPWLAAGCISPREILVQLIRYENEFGGNESTYWVKFELLWRDYFRFVMMKYGKKLFYEGGIRNIKRIYTEDLNLFKRWCTGNTGEPFVDANMRELWHTGFMSNRGRQNVASYLVHDLHINWLWGAAWFEHLLIDNDVYSNYGNWQYVAGVGNDPREGRKFNIKRQQEMYDADGAYVDYWCKE